MRQAQQVISDFNAILNLLDQIETKLYTYRHYKIVKKLLNNLSEAKEDLKLQIDRSNRKLGYNEEK